jgi:hypothetical protein
MTDKANIRKISLAALGASSMCALTLLTSTPAAQAAPRDGGEVPISTAPLEIQISTNLAADAVATSTLQTSVPDADAVGRHIGDVIGPKGPKGGWPGLPVDITIEVDPRQRVRIGIDVHDLITTGTTVLEQ